MTKSSYSRDDDRRFMSYESRAAEGDSRFVKAAKAERKSHAVDSVERVDDRYVATCSCSWHVSAATEAAAAEQARIHVAIESR